MGNYSLKIDRSAANRLQLKAQQKGMDLAEYLRTLIAFAETLDDMTTDETLIVLHKSKVDRDREITIPVRALKHG